MADDARQSPPDLASAEPLSERFDFFELLRRLERTGRLIGRAGRPDREPARLGQQVRLGFSVQDVVEYREASGNNPARVTVANIGLLGPEGPMPLHVTRWVLDRLSQRWFAGAEARQTSDTTFPDFINILQHRMIALFYRAWADAHPGVQVERPGSDGVRSMMRSLAGIGLPGTENSREPMLDAVKMRQAAALALQANGPERLALFVAEAFQVPVRLMEFIAAWIEVPRALQTSVGRDHATLGSSAAIGPRTFTRQSKVELRIGPLPYSTYTTFLPGSSRLALLGNSVRDLIGEMLDVDLRIVLAKDEVPEPRLGQVSLGRTAWLARPGERGDADDLRLRTIVGWRPEPARLKK